MFKIKFYADGRGKEPVREYIESLQDSADTNKDSRIKLSKIFDYMEILSRNGTRAGEPYMKHVDGDIWELRPLQDRIFFFGWRENVFVLLHHFVKKTQKTPLREIETAKQRMKKLLERSIKNESKNIPDRDRLG